MGTVHVRFTGVSTKRSKNGSCGRWSPTSATTGSADAWTASSTRSASASADRVMCASPPDSTPIISLLLCSAPSTKRDTPCTSRASTPPTPAPRSPAAPLWVYTNRSRGCGRTWSAALVLLLPQLTRDLPRGSRRYRSRNLLPRDQRGEALGDKGGSRRAYLQSPHPAALRTRDLAHRRGSGGLRAPSSLECQDGKST